jgi:glycogen debranching enzyme
MARRLGELGGEAWAERAEAIREAVEARFWMEEAGFYGIAVDGEGLLCTPPTSNPGHLLFTGLPSPERAAKVTRQLLAAEFDSGWGIRTLSLGAARFNPMSYHNGSVWPHDTAICALGMSHYGERKGVVALTAALFETAAHFEMRLPELFCGFHRQAGEPPVAYPVACLPQAWAAGSVFMMLQACLGLSVDGETGHVTLVDPHLPIGIDRLWIDNLELCGAPISLAIERHGDRIKVVTDAEDGVVIVR